MKILACIKEATIVPGPVVFASNGTDINPDFTSQRISEADEQAVEEAVRLAEAQEDSEAVVVTVGDQGSTKTLRHALAIGASRAIRLWRDDLSLFDPLAIARSLAQAVRDERPDLVLCGVQSTDLAQQITGPALAAHLGWPCTTTAVAIEVEADGGEATVTRDVGAGVRELVRISLPAVVTVQLGINRPRTPSFKQVMQAKKASIEEQPIDSGQTQCVRVTKLSKNTSSASDFEPIEGGPSNVASKIKSLIEES